MTDQDVAVAKAPPVAAPTGNANPHFKRPLLACCLSAMPGAGNLYNGLYLRGVVFFLLLATLIALVPRYPLLGFAIAFFWIFNMIDAYRQATLINWGYANDLGVTDLPERPSAGQGGVIAGSILFLLGFFAVLDRYFRVDVDWLIDLWPFGLMAIGAWVAWSAFKERTEKPQAGGLEEE